MRGLASCLRTPYLHMLFATIPAGLRTFSPSLLYPLLIACSVLNRHELRKVTRGQCISFCSSPAMTITAHPLICSAGSTPDLSARNDTDATYEESISPEMNISISLSLPAPCSFSPHSPLTYSLTHSVVPARLRFGWKLRSR